MEAHYKFESFMIYMEKIVHHGKDFICQEEIH